MKPVLIAQFGQISLCLGWSDRTAKVKEFRDLGDKMEREGKPMAAQLARNHADLMDAELKQRREK